MFDTKHEAAYLYESTKSDFNQNNATGKMHCQILLLPIFLHLI